MGEKQRRQVTIARMCSRLAVFAAVFLCLDVFFWLTADFGRFVPPSEGTLHERLYYAGVVASGPFGVYSVGKISDELEDIIPWTLASATLVSCSLLWRRALLARMCGYLGVLLWFLFGHAWAFLRIT